MLLDLHANHLQIESHPLQHIDCYALSKFDQSEQEVFSSHVVVVEPLGLLARKRQDLLEDWARLSALPEFLQETISNRENLRASMILPHSLS